MKSKQEQKKGIAQKFSIYTTLVVLCFLLAIVAIIAYMATFVECTSITVSLNHTCEFTSEIAVWGQTGDFFGGLINPLVGLTTILLVLKTLRQNQEALDISKTELEKSTQALQMQSKLMASEYHERAFLRITDKLADMLKIKHDTFYFILGEHNKKLTCTSIEAAYLLISNNNSKINESDFKSRQDALSNLFESCVKEHMPYLSALSEIYQLETEDTAKHMLALQLIAATDKIYLVVLLVKIERIIDNIEVRNNFGIASIQFAKKLHIMLDYATNLYDGKIDYGAV